MNLPHRFDGNEWFIIVASVVVYTLIFFLPKQYRVSQAIFFWLFNLFIANLSDFLLATAPLNLYDINDGPDYELFDLLIYILLYGPTAYLSVYFYDRWKLKGGYAALYVIAWSLVTVGLEYAAEFFHIYKFHGWKHIYSLPSYALLYLMNLAFFRIMRHFYTPGHR